MARRQRELDPGGGPAVELARALRALRARAGDPKFAAMARRTGRSKTALAEAAGGRRVPRWETVEDFVRACDGDPSTWHERWNAARTAERSAPVPPVTEPDAAPVVEADAVPAPVEQPDPVAPASRRRPPLRGGVAVAAVVAVLAVVGAAVLGFALGRSSVSPYTEVGPLLRAIEVQNKVALGADRLVEDSTPAYLSTLPLAYCAAPSRGCKVRDTEMGSGVGIVANCVTTGQRMWNYDLGEAAAQDNPHRAESDLWYRVSFPDGRSGYLAEVYVTESSRGGLDLPTCGPVATP